jgi:hypothetical protein
MGDLASQFESHDLFEAVYEVGINTYGGQRKLQLNFKDFRFG